MSPPLKRKHSDSESRASSSNYKFPRNESSTDVASCSTTVATPVCVFCNQGPSDDPLISKLSSKDGLSAHQHCVFFAASLVQMDETIPGQYLFGFKLDDIRKEIRRVGSLKCYYCRKGRAACGCNINRCKKAFHFTCGLANGVMFNFDKFSSHCPDHQSSQQAIPLHLIEAGIASTSGESNCAICNEAVPAKIGFWQLYCPHCYNWFHRKCLQEWASSAGLHHCRCPACSDGGHFVAELKRYGFHLPDQDASWEIAGMFRDQEEDAPDLLCNAKACLVAENPEGIKRGGRKYAGTVGGHLDLLSCALCGENGVHRCCLHDKHQHILDGQWVCRICRVALTKEERKAYETRDVSSYKGKPMKHKRRKRKTDGESEKDKASTRHHHHHHQPENQSQESLTQKVVVEKVKKNQPRRNKTTGRRKKKKPQLPSRPPVKARPASPPRSHVSSIEVITLDDSSDVESIVDSGLATNGVGSVSSQANCSSFSTYK